MNIPILFSFEIRIQSLSWKGGKCDGKDNGDCENKGMRCQMLRHCGKKDDESLQARQEKIGNQEKQ